MKKIVIIFTLAFFIPPTLICGGIYKYSVQDVIQLNGGQLFLPSSKKSNENIYFIKSGLMGEDAALHNVSPNDYSLLSGKRIEGSRVIQGHRCNSNLYILLISSDTLYLNVYSQNKLLHNIYITIDSESVFGDVSFLSIHCEEILLKVGRMLYLFVFQNNDLERIQLLSDNCISYALFNIHGHSTIAIVEDSGEFCFLRLIDKDGITFHSQIIPYSEIINLKNIHNMLVLVFGSTTNSNSLINTIDLQAKSLSNSFWIPSSAEFTCINKDSKLFYLTYEDGSYKLVADNSIVSANDRAKTSIPRELVEPIHFQLFEEFILIIFKNAIITYNYDLSIRSFDFLPFGKWFKKINSVEYIENQFILASNHFSVVLIEDINQFWQLKSLMSQFGQFIVPIILLLIILIITKKYRKERRLVQTLLDMPAAGFLYIIDKSGQLIEGNEFGRKLLGLKKNIPMKRQFRYYFKIESVLAIYAFYEEIEKTNKTETRKINISIGGEPKELLCYAVPISNIAGGMNGLILSGIDITEQLERKRLTNWAQLAHDLQTNLSTIRLNTEHLDTNDNESDKSRKKKILHQVNILMNRIRDVITVGRSDDLVLSVVSSSDICNDVRMEFDEVLFPNVSFQLDIKEFTFKCDRQKLIRALRNAIENGIRATRDKQGEIILSCTIAQRNIVFSVKDNGIGMDEDTRKKFLTPYFTTGNKFGGSGIGTMIMLRVAELHHGHLNIISEPNKGTEIQFILPMNREK